MTRLARAALTLIPCLLAFSSAAPARARGLETVWLELPDCATPPYDPRELLRSLEIELSPYHLRVQTQPAGNTQPGLSVSVGLARCDARADSLTLVFGDALGQRSRERELPLRDVPKPARARTLALVIAEALRPSRWAAETDAREQSPDEPDAGSSPDPPSLAPAMADPLRADARHEPPTPALPGRSADTPALTVHDDPLFQTEDPYPWPGRFRLGLDAQALLETRHNNLLLGFGLSAHGALLRRSQWALELSYFGGDAKTPAGGALNLRWWTAAAGLDVPLTSSPRLKFGPRFALSRLEDSDASTAVLLTTYGGRASLSAQFTPEMALNVHLEVDRSLQVVALTPGRDSLPWYGWMLTWGAGLSFDI
jgi:hypothetical protein